MAPPSPRLSKAEGQSRRPPTKIQSGFKGFAPLTPVPRRLGPLRALRRQTP